MESVGRRRELYVTEAFEEGWMGGDDMKESSLWVGKATLYEVEHIEMGKRSFQRAHNITHCAWLKGEGGCVCVKDRGA